MRISRQLPVYLLLVALLVSVSLLSLRLNQAEPTAPVPAQLQLPEPGTFTESFSSTTYRDINYSTALWDTDTGTLSVPYNRDTAQALSLPIDTVSDNIKDATLTFVASNNQGTVAFFLSNDTGITYEPVTPGQTHVFTSEGSKLKWKAVLTKSDSGQSPILDEVTVTYSIAEPDHLVTMQAVDQINLAIETSRQLFADGAADEVILGRNDDVIDTFVATPLAVQRNAPLLFTPGDHLDASTALEMARVLGDRTKPVRIVGGDAVIGNGVIGDLFAQGFGNVYRTAGKNRYETARAIAQEIVAVDPTATKRVYLTEARLLADAFSAAAPAGAQLDGVVHPIVLTERETREVSRASKEFILQAKPDVLVVVGGPASITDAAITELAGHTTIRIERVFGEDRFATNAAMVQQNFLAPETIVVAGGKPSSDTVLSQYERLLGGLVAANHGGPLLFATPDTLPDALVTYLYNQADAITKAIVVGTLENPDISTQLYNLISRD